MKKWLLLIFTIIVLTINIYTVNAETIEKSNISVELLDHTYYCDEKCYTKYEVCYDKINLNQDLTTKFKSDKNETLEPENYLERYEIEMGETQNCRKLTVHGKKGIFENIDNVICIYDVCFDEFLWWNTSWFFRTEINFTNYVPNGFFFPIIISVIDKIFWVIKVPEQMYLYSQIISTDLMIGNETHSLYWENDSLALTGNYNQLIYDAVWCSHLHNGSIIDSCNFINGSLIGSPTFQQGVYGNGTYFDSSNDAVDSNIIIDVGINFTVSLWIKEVGTFSGYSNLYGSGGNIENTLNSYLYTIGKWFTFLRRSNGVVQHIRHADYTNLTGEIDLGDGKLHNIIYMVNGTSINDMHIYVDKIKLETYVQANDGLVSSGGFLNYSILVGGHNYDGSMSDNLEGGLIDEFIIWNRSLSVDEMNVIYWGGHNNLTFSGTQYQYEPPFVSPNMTIQITSAFNDNYYKTNSTCLNDNTLYVEWKKTVLVDILEESYSLNHTDSQIVHCPYGCTSEFDEFGGGCVKPDWQMYGFIIIAIVIIILVMLYFKKDR